MTEENDMTWVDWCKKIGAEYGLSLSDDAAGWFLWNETGYPSFVPSGTTAQEHFGRQLRVAFARSSDR